MPVEPLFPPWTNGVARASVLGLLVAVGVAAALPMAWVRTPNVTGVGFRPEQPVMFDHRHHVQDDGIDCRYCHAEAERSRYAGIPSTDVCMGCHAQVWNTSPLLQAVRDSAARGVPIAWRRVHDLPDFVFFDHHAHVRRGVACASCHGDVGAMAKVYAVAPLTMGWCLDCHRNPPAGTAPPTDCTGCHR